MTSKLYEALRPIILVLDDDAIRVDPLRDKFSDVVFLRTDNAHDFFVELDKAERSGKLILIILDHDLGTSGTGLDVARKINTKVVTVVWSMNSVRGPEMYRTLRDRGIPSLYIPFSQKLSIHTMIGEFVSKYYR